MMQNLQNFPLPVLSIEDTAYPDDRSMFLKELVDLGHLRDSTRREVLDAWPWMKLDFGGGEHEITSQMVADRTNEELLSIGISRDRMYELRKAVKNDPMVLTNAFPEVSEKEVRDWRRGAFSDGETIFGPDGRPLQAEPAVGTDGPADAAL